MIMTKYKKTTCLKKLIEVERPTLVLVEHPEQALSQKSVLQCSMAMAMVMVMLMVMMAPVCDSTQNVKRYRYFFSGTKYFWYRYRYFFRYYFFLVPVPIPPEKMKNYSTNFFPIPRKNYKFLVPVRTYVTFISLYMKVMAGLPLLRQKQFTLVIILQQKMVFFWWWRCLFSQKSSAIKPHNHQHEANPTHHKCWLPSLREWTSFLRWPHLDLLPWTHSQPHEPPPGLNSFLAEFSYW